MEPKQSNHVNSNSGANQRYRHPVTNGKCRETSIVFVVVKFLGYDLIGSRLVETQNSLRSVTCFCFDLNDVSQIGVVIGRPANGH